MPRKAPKPMPARVREPILTPLSTTIPAGEFKAKCLALMDEVSARGIAYVITKRGTPIAKLVPVVEEAGKRSKPRGYGALKGMLKITGDVMGPIESPEVWGAGEDSLYP